MQNLRIGTTEYIVSEPVDRPLSGRSYSLQGPRGAAYIAVTSTNSDPHTFKVLGMSRYGALRELRHGGYRVRLTDESGSLEVVQ